MIFWWIWNIVLLFVVAPVVVFLLAGVLKAARSIPPVIDLIGPVAEAASKDLDAVVQLLTTQSYVSQTIATVENYGGSLDILLEDA
ncbi:MAG: hypothetical protein M3296_05925 [Actinomycetota bacterium]|nr:hypothetical protein [Actinomycetota bacterium]